MALWKFSKLDMWQIRLRVTGSSHSAETKELGTEDPSDVSAPLCTGSSCHHPPGDTKCWWGVTTNCQGQEEAVPGDESISSQSAVSEHSAFPALMESVSLTNAHTLPCSYWLHGLEGPAGITLQLLKKRHCNIHMCSEWAFGFGQLHSLQFSYSFTGQGAQAPLVLANTHSKPLPTVWKITATRLNFSFFTFSKNFSV